YDSSLVPVEDFATIVQSTLSGNSAQYGGGLFHDSESNPAQVTLVNSTVSGNTAYRPSNRARPADGARLYVVGGQGAAYNTTVAENRVLVSHRPGHAYSGVGGGLYVTATAVLTLQNSIIATNLNGDGLTAWQPDDCFAGGGATGWLTYDLIFTNTGCALGGTQ